MLESVFNKVTGLKACKFIKKRLHHRRFPVKFEIFKNTFFYRTPLVAAFVRRPKVLKAKAAKQLLLKSHFGMGVLL